MSIHDQLQNMLQISRKEDKIEAVPFVQTFRRESVKTDCQHLTFKKMGKAGFDGPFGNKYPYCQCPSLRALYIQDSRRIISCQGCEYYRKK